MSDPFTQLKPVDLERHQSRDWIESSMDLSDNGNKSGIETGFLSLSLSGKKLRWFFAGIFFILIVLLAKSFWLQIVAGNKYFTLAENNRIKVEYSKAHRGVIVDRKGGVLVNNLFGFSISILPSDLPKDGAVKTVEFKRLAELVGIPEEEISARLAGSDSRLYQPIIIRTGVPYDQAMKIKIAAEEFPGVELNIDAWRLYPISEPLAHLLGYVGKIDAAEYAKFSSQYLFTDNIGKAGLEKYYESYLKGKDGIKRIEVDAFGREKKILSQSQQVAGDNLVLAIDADLQEKIYEILKKSIPSKRGAVIVSNPQNGEVLAMVDFPSFDNNLFTGGINSEEYQKLLADHGNPLFSRSILGEYPSGSTVKPVLAAGALEEKVVTKDTTVNSTGGISVGKWFFPDWKAGGHGVTNVTKALAWSINTYFYYIGGGFGDFTGLGLERIDKYFRLFGLGQPTGIDLPGEKSGLVPDAQWKKDTKNQDWYIGDTYHLSIGQGDLLVTPLQVNSYTAAIANGGKLFVPRLALSAIHPDGSKILFPPKIIRDIPVGSENLAIVREGIRETVTVGSAQSLNSLSIKAAGKTGTAQWSDTKPNHAWFTGFAPYDNPNFCITVLVEEGGEGSAIAVPIAKEVMQWWFSRK